MRVTGEQLKSIVGGTAPLATQAATTFTQYSDEFGVNTPLRASHFWCQIGHESMLNWVQEIWGPTPAQIRYEGRLDLGNTVAGDGKRYMGRSLIQVTGRANYTEFTLWMRKRIPTCPDFVADPEKLEEFPWAMMGAFWFWSTRRLNTFADKDNVVGATKKINGGSNGLAERKAILARAKVVFGVEDGDAVVTPKSKPVRKPKGQWAEKLLPSFEVVGVQQQLIKKGFHKVGLVDGIWGDATTAAITMLQEAGKRLDPSIVVDGHYGPQTKALLDNPGIKASVTTQRLETTAKDLANKGNPVVIQGRQIQWASLLSILGTVASVLMLAFQNYTSGATSVSELPWAVQAALNFMPPWVTMIIPFAVALYNAAVAKGIVGAEVASVREGINNSGFAPETAPKLPWPFNMIGGR